MPRTLEQLRSSVLDYGFSPQKYSSSVDRWIDEAQRMVFRRANLRNKEVNFGFNTVAGTKEYALPTDFASVTYLFSETKPGFNLENFRTIQEYNEATETSGEPLMYIVDGQSIKLWPQPDGVYSMQFRYKKIPSSIVGEASASPTIAEDYYDLLEEYALAKAYSRENDREESEFHMNIFEKKLIEFTGQMNHATDNYPDQIIGSMEPTGYWE